MGSSSVWMSHSISILIFWSPKASGICMWFSVDMWSSGDVIGQNLIGQNYLGWQELRNWPNDTRPHFTRPFVSRNGKKRQRLGQIIVRQFCIHFLEWLHTYVCISICVCIRTSSWVTRQMIIIVGASLSESAQSAKWRENGGIHASWLVEQSHGSSQNVGQWW